MQINFGTPGNETSHSLCYIWEPKSSKSFIWTGWFSNYQIGTACAHQRLRNLWNVTKICVVKRKWHELFKVKLNNGKTHSKRCPIQKINSWIKEVLVHELLLLTYILKLALKKIRSIKSFFQVELDGCSKNIYLGNWNQLISSHLTVPSCFFR